MTSSFCNFVTPTILLIMSGDGFIVLYNLNGFREVQKVFIVNTKYDLIIFAKLIGTLKNPVLTV
eukprot:TRINITY_DN410_c0_g1_i1.p1 TRINITY_DN410_c0_g1~~TRINITY_DN410_c0_g1_i1.p1  ORF type:complete len:64 (-),score=9.17 TRINITY_DN410_c0_g1_i1:114-305(-)